MQLRLHNLLGSDSREIYAHLTALQRFCEKIKSGEVVTRLEDLYEQ